MARRGYFERQGSEYRLRIVKPGFDADDVNVSPNNVIIDSHSKGTLSILDSGIGNVPSYAAFRAGHWVVTWSLPFVPLCSLMFGTSESSAGPWSPTLPSGVTDWYQKLHVTTTGIFMQQTRDVSMGSGNFPFYVKWVSYRLPVAL